MAKAVLRFSNSSNPDYLIITWALFATPFAEISRQVYAAPHPQRSLTIENLDPVMHRFTFWQSVDGSALTTRLLDMDIDCSINESEFVIYEYVVDRGSSGSNPNWADPVAGDVTVNDERLIGSNFYVERRGIGKYRPDEIIKNNIMGFFTVQVPMENDDTYFSIVEKRITQQTLPVPSSDYLDIVQVDDSMNFTSDMYRKYVEVITAMNTPVLSVPAFSSIPKTKVLINTHSMTGRYFTIAFSGIEAVKFINRDFNKITLGRGEEIELLFTGSNCKVLRYEGDYRNLGNINFGRGIENNVIPLDGSLFNIADYPRLFYDFINLLPVTQIKTMTLWGTSQVINGITEYPNKGFFAVDLTAGEFRVPDFRNRTIRSLKLSGITDPLRLSDFPGGFQMDAVGKFTASVTVPKGNSYTGNPNNTRFANGAANPEDKIIPNVVIDSGSPETISRNIGLIPQVII